MKVFLRVTVVILILAGLGFGTYALFFKPANKEQVFLKLSEYAEHEEDIKFSESLTNMGNFSTPANYGSVDKYRKMFDQYADYSIRQGYSKVEINYVNLQDELDEVFQYYMSYSQAVSKTVSKSKYKEITKSVKSTKESLSNVKSKIDSIVALQTAIKEQSADNKTDLSQDLEGRYKNAVGAYNTFLLDYINLIEKSKAFVTTYVYRDEMIVDRTALLYDLEVKALKKALSYPTDTSENTAKSDDYFVSALSFINLSNSSTIANAYVAQDTVFDVNYNLAYGSLYTETGIKYYEVWAGTIDIKVGVGGDNNIYKYGDIDYSTEGWGNDANALQNYKYIDVIFGDGNTVKDPMGSGYVTARKKLDFNEMIRCYNIILDGKPELIDTIINMSTAEKRSYVVNFDNASIPNEYKYSVGYLLASCGFLG